MNHFDIDDTKDLADLVLEATPAPEDNEDDEDGYYPMLVSSE